MRRERGYRVIPAKVFYVLCGMCLEVALLAAYLHNSIVIPAFLAAVVLYHYSDLMNKE